MHYTNYINNQKNELDITLSSDFLNLDAKASVKDAIPELKLNIDKLDLDYIGFKNYQILD